ncbi:MAG TPA: CHAD domain-containing protein [Candidatus Krumholzibacteria bacterium]|nr:CHAD domain-containing protein [Candidatus Krumholzibacteria bacterium]
MSYRFEPGEKVERGVKRMAREQIDKALAEIDSDELDVHERVHQVRKRCKKLRAIARLVRPPLGSQYSGINRHYRDAARPLSDARDAHAIIESFDDVVEDRSDEIVDGSLDPVREAFVRRRERVAPREEVETRLFGARQALTAGRAALDTWHVDEDGFDAVAGGVKKVVRRGRKAMGAATEKPTVENYHEWRKRAKYLWYHARMLRPLWPEVMKAWRDEADRLSDLLGDEHDGAVLRAILQREPEMAEVEGMPLYLALLDRRSQELRARARRLGARIHAEKPKRFVGRLEDFDAADGVLA